MALNNKKDHHTIINATVFTGVEGIEPSSGVLETLILPMNYTPLGRKVSSLCDDGTIATRRHFASAKCWFFKSPQTIATNPRQLCYNNKIATPCQPNIMNKKHMKINKKTEKVNKRSLTFLPHLGQRIIKTSIAVFLCLLIHYIRLTRGCYFVIIT